MAKDGFTFFVMTSGPRRLLWHAALHGAPWPQAYCGQEVDIRCRHGRSGTRAANHAGDLQQARGFARARSHQMKPFDGSGLALNQKSWSMIRLAMNGSYSKACARPVPCTQSTAAASLPGNHSSTSLLRRLWQACLNDRSGVLWLPGNVSPNASSVSLSPRPFDRSPCTGCKRARHSWRACAGVQADDGSSGREYSWDTRGCRAALWRLDPAALELLSLPVGGRVQRGGRASQEFRSVSGGRCGQREALIPSAH